MHTTAHRHSRLRDATATTIKYIRGREPIMLIVLLLIVVGSWGFIALAGEVIEGDTDRFDRWAVQSLRQADNPSVPIGPAWLASVGRDVTAAGRRRGIDILHYCIGWFSPSAERIERCGCW
ncbi:MAG: hypothetical protein R3C05_07515 [Pirellulaceae bacterium]